METGRLGSASGGGGGGGKDIVSGWLSKKGGINPAFRRRWFMLMGQELRYFRSELEAQQAFNKPLGVINVGSAVAVVSVFELDG
jgi:hypothetical protein